MELGLGICLWNYVELFWNSLDNASIVFYSEMKVELEVGVLDFRSRFTPRAILYKGRNVPYTLAASPAFCGPLANLRLHLLENLPPWLPQGRSMMLYSLGP